MKVVDQASASQLNFQNTLDPFLDVPEVKLRYMKKMIRERHTANRKESCFLVWYSGLTGVNPQLGDPLPAHFGV